MQTCLRDRTATCIDCGKCDMCEYKHKLCDNCFACLDIGATDYRAILVDAIMVDSTEVNLDEKKDEMNMD